MGKLKIVFFGLIVLLLFGIFMIHPGNPAYAEPLGFTSTPTPLPTPTPTPDPGIPGAVSGLNIKKYPSQTSVERGETFSFEILVKNKTNSTKKKIAVRDTVPGVYHILNVTTGKGVVNFDTTQNDIVIEIDQLLPDEEVVIQVQVQVKESAVGTEDFCNMASIESNGGKPQYSTRACVSFDSVLLPATGLTKPGPSEFNFFGLYPFRAPTVSATKGEESLEWLGQDNTRITRLVIPFLGVDVDVRDVVFDGNSWDVSQLSQKVGWLETTSLPGNGGNTVLAGHITGALDVDGPFRYLLYLQPGEKIFAYTARGVYVYQVRDQGIISPEKNWVLNPTEAPQLTLLTCATWDDATKSYLLRRVVFADLVEISPVLHSRQKAAFRMLR